MNKRIVTSVMALSLLLGSFDAREVVRNELVGAREACDVQLIKIVDKIQDAIEDSDVRGVEQLLKELGTLSQKGKKELLEIAKRTSDERRSSVNLLKSRLDLAKVLMGGLLAGAGIVAERKTVGRSFSFPFLSEGLDTVVAVKVPSGVGLLLLIPGLYLAVKGLNCSTACGSLEASKNIEKLVEKWNVIPKRDNSSVSESFS